MLGGSNGSGVFRDTGGVGVCGVGFCGVGVCGVVVCGVSVCGVGSVCGDSDAGGVGGGGLSALIGEYNYLHSFWWHRDSPAHNALLHFFAPSLYIGLHNLHKPCIWVCTIFPCLVYNGWHNLHKPCILVCTICTQQV